MLSAAIGPAELCVNLRMQVVQPAPLGLPVLLLVLVVPRLVDIRAPWQARGIAQQLKFPLARRKETQAGRSRA